MLFSIALLVSMPVCAGDVLSFLTHDFKTFVNTAVPAAEREKFANYYGKVNAKLKSKQSKEKLELSYSLRKAALDAMKSQHRSWSNDITAFMTDPHYLDAAYDSEREKLRDFLSWQGAYVKFQETTNATQTVALAKKAPSFDSAKMMDSVKTQVAKAKDKIGGWFGKLKTKLT